MSHHEQRAPGFGGDFPKEGKHLSSGLRIERPCRFVSQKNRGVPGDRPRDRYALPLSDRHLIRPGVNSITQIDPSKNLNRPLPDIALFSRTKTQTDGNILERGEWTEQVKRLKHHPTVRSPVPVKLGRT